MKEYFDLNIEKVLEHWSISFAIREFISNALDEQIITQTKSIKVYKDGNNWHIRDFGRGIQSKHFSQNENPEKLSASNLIGKFGVGMKDALAVLDRHNIDLKLTSRYCNVHTEMHEKGDFKMKTLHAVFEPVEDSDFIGTDVCIYNIDDEIIVEAKSFFLCFLDEHPLETTKNGEIYLVKDIPSIYVNGLQVAQEENFLFSYNITNITASLKKALNRERSNVGRTAYSNSVKSILLNCKSEKSLAYLVGDLENYTKGGQKDESKWIDVACYAAEILDKTGKYVFVSAFSPLDTNQREIVENSGRKIITLPDDILLKLGKNIYTYDDALKQYNDSFEIDEVNYEQLSLKEKNVFDYASIIRDFFKKNTNLKPLPSVKITNSLGLSVDAEGFWDQKAIWILRKVLKEERRFIEVISHEYAHSLNNYEDNTRNFENDLGEVFSYYALYLLKKGN